MFCFLWFRPWIYERQTDSRMKIDNYKKYSPSLLRIALSLVFLWFGSNQLINTELWISFLPSWTGSLPLSQTSFVLFNGIFEIVLGSLLLLGLLTRIASLLLSLHLFGIAFSLGYNDLAIRDLGLALATFSVFLHGNDLLCLDNKIKRI